MKLIKTTLLLTTFVFTAITSNVSAATDQWYVYASKVNGYRMCAQASPGSGWYKASPNGYSTKGACNYYER
ncbi:hypothetical protein [Pseudoalteromonas ostreae]|uniref:hypothetical protein n=1 Tax=Pseudoalteromonas ostreae TaxID=2774154 RepID=UPI001B385552|nr:hypothetical protein [Pseudoalteromonas ostreae]